MKQGRATTHRKTVKHFHEAGHLHELTFSCYGRMPLLTNSPWQEKLARCTDAAGRETAIELVGFVFMPCYPRSQTLYIVLDNYGTHLKTEVLTWAKSHKIRFYFTPTNASWLNRIECQFTAMKKFALNHSDFRSHEEQESIERYLTWRNRQRPITQVCWRKHRSQQRLPA